ncbi:hypothetical protein ACFL12_00645 [Pseudomonadota bacterium]
MTRHIAYNNMMKVGAWIIALLLMIGLCSDVRAECKAGYVEVYDRQGKPICVSEGYLRTQKQIKTQSNRTIEKEMQGEVDRSRTRQPQTEEEIRQRIFRDELERSQRRRILQQRSP